MKHDKMQNFKFFLINKRQAPLHLNFSIRLIMSSLTL